MNAILLTAVMLALGAQDVQTTAEPKTQLYVKTVPSGAAIMLDDKFLGKSDGLFEVAPGSHKLTLQMEGFVAEARSIEASDGKITRVEVELKRLSSGQIVLSHVGDSSDAKQSFADSGHAVAFQRPAEMRSIAAVRLFATRYGREEPPDEDFFLYLLDEKQKVLERIPIPYSKIERGKLHWCDLEVPAIDIPEKFFVAVWFNAQATKGVFLGMDKNVRQTHSYIGLPDKGYQKVDEAYDWMIRAVVSNESGKKPTRPKVTTYEEEKAADTESKEALPTRTWSDSSGAFSVEAKFLGVEEGKVKLQKADGKIVNVPLERLSKEDREFVSKQGNTKKQPQHLSSSSPAPLSQAGEGSHKAEALELSHDNGTKAGTASLAGSGHAVRFQVEGDSWSVTSVSLHGSRYGEPRPPKEDFNVWICDAQFKPIAAFQFPYSSYTRGKPGWKSFRISPTPVPREFIICFEFNPQATKGVFVSHDNQPGKNSMVGVPGKSEPNPFAKGNWMIRCKVEKRAESRPPQQ